MVWLGGGYLVTGEREGDSLWGQGCQRQLHLEFGGTGRPVWQRVQERSRECPSIDLGCKEETLEPFTVLKGVLYQAVTNYRL